MTDLILVRQLAVDAIIGIHEWERQQTQPLFIDLDLSFDCKTAAASDDIHDALDYFEVCRKVTDLVADSRVELIETLAENITQLILNKFNCHQVKLSLYKPQAIENAQTVGITLIRANQ